MVISKHRSLICRSKRFLWLAFFAFLSGLGCLPVFAKSKNLSPDELTALYKQIEKEERMIFSAVLESNRASSVFSDLRIYADPEHMFFGSDNAVSKHAVFNELLASFTTHTGNAALVMDTAGRMSLSHRFYETIADLFVLETVLHRSDGIDAILKLQKTLEADYVINTHIPKGEHRKKALETFLQSLDATKDKSRDTARKVILAAPLTHHFYKRLRGIIHAKDDQLKQVDGSEKRIEAHIDDIIKGTQGIATSIAHRLAANQELLAACESDLRELAIIRLEHVARMYEYKMGYSFSALATKDFSRFIRREMRDVVSLIHFPEQYLRSPEAENTVFLSLNQPYHTSRDKYVDLATILANETNFDPENPHRIPDVAEKIMARTIDESLTRLNPTSALIIKLYYLSDRDKEISQEQLAETLGISVSQVKRRLSAAIEALRHSSEIRALLTQLYGQPESPSLNVQARQKAAKCAAKLMRRIK